MASAGLTQGLSDAAGVVGGTSAAQAPIADRLAHEALRQSIQAGSSLIANTAINGGDFSKNAVDALTLAAVSTIGVIATQEIGTAYKQAILDGQIDPLEYVLQKVAHAAVGCGTAAATGASCGAGAAGAAAGAVVTEALFDPAKKVIELAAALREGDVTQSDVTQILFDWQRQGADLAKLAGGLAAMVAGAKTAGDVNTAANSGETVAAHNVLETALDIASLAVSLNELRIVLTDADSSKLDILLAGGAVVIDGIATVVPFLPGGAGIVLKASKKGGEAVIKITTKAGDDITEAVKFADKDVWTLPATERGKVIEQRLAQTDYKDWFNVGQEKNGYFPLVDFQKGDTLVSLKSVDTTGTTWMSRMTDHIIDLGNSGVTVNGNPANMVLDLRVQPGGADLAGYLKDFGKTKGVTVRITEVAR